MNVIDHNTQIPLVEGALEAVTARLSMLEGVAISFEYDDKTRVVEPHAIGLSSKDGSLVMRGYLLNDERPWRLFTLSKVKGMFLTERTSQAPRDGYKMDDKQMSTVITEIQL